MHCRCAQQLIGELGISQAPAGCVGSRADRRPCSDFSNPVGKLMVASSHVLRLTIQSDHWQSQPTGTRPGLGRRSRAAHSRQRRRRRSRPCACSRRRCCRVFQCHSSGAATGRSRRCCRRRRRCAAGPVAVRRALLRPRHRETERLHFCRPHSDDTCPNRTSTATLCAGRDLTGHHVWRIDACGQKGVLVGVDRCFRSAVPNIRIAR